MTEPNTPPQKSTPLTGRRVALMASVAGIGAALLFAGPNGPWQSAFGSSASAADSTAL